MRATIEHDDDAGFSGGGQLVRDGEHGGAGGQDTLAQGIAERGVAGRVDQGGGLVQE